MSVQAIRALVSGYPRRLWGAKLLVMLQAMVDDSVSHIEGRRLFLAGYVQIAEAWIKFADDWDEELRRAPSIDYFKMSEATSRGGQFKGFSDPERYGKIFALARLIEKHRPWGFHSSVSCLEFNKLLKPFAPHPMKTPYFPLCYAMIFGVAQLNHSFGLHVPCDFIFDNHDGLPAKVVPLFDIALSRRPESWAALISGTPTFRDDKDVLPIQAADMLAWHVRRRDDGNYPPELEGLDELLIFEGVHHYSEIDTETLEHLADGLRAIPFAGDLDSKKKWQEILPFVRQSFEAKRSR